MNATEAHQALLVRAFETPIAAPWTEGDAAWASAEAHRLEGEGATADRLLARRAALACERLAKREPAITAALAARSGHTGWAWGAVGIAFAIGLALDAIGPAQRLNIVALPMLGVLGWNLVVYALLLLGAAGLWGKAPAALSGDRWRSSLQRWMGRDTGRLGTPALRRYLVDAKTAGAPLDASRLTFVLHAGAAALAAGLLASMYARGLAFEYRAGWDSTFLSPQAVHRLLSIVLWPALSLTGDALPTPEQLAGLRFSVGPGENAARWIHWLALTVAGVVLLPRGVLAAGAARRARQFARSFPIDLEAPYFQRLLRAPGDTARTVQVLPYSYRVAPELLPGLEAVLRQALGARVDVQVTQSLPVGSEDDLPSHLQHASPSAEMGAAAPGAPPRPVRLPLFPLTATPERETHAAFLRALAAIDKAGASAVAQAGLPFDVMIDESAFRRQFDATRLAQRRAAWQQLLSDVGRRPLFVDLGQPDAMAVARALDGGATALHY
jgi:hypothetical protein